ncbi:MAG: RNA polymerase sigma factor [Clostridia bacterium]|nr:RNA polymerase sigma factor [Clostridia bacterium]
MKKEMKKLVRSAISGDKDAFGTLYEIYSVDMYRFALSMCKNSFDAQDAVQETVLSVFKSIHGVKNPEKFKSYLFSSLSNTCKRKLLENYHIVEFEDEGYVDSEIEFSIPVREALSRLDEDSRQILMLSIAGGFKSREIGEMLKIPANTVRTKHKRALEKMREELSL